MGKHVGLPPIPPDFFDELGSHGFLQPAKDTNVNFIPLVFTRSGVGDGWAALVQRVTRDVLSMSSIRHRQCSVREGGRGRDCEPCASSDL